MNAFEYPLDFIFFSACLLGFEKQETKELNELKMTFMSRVYEKDVVIGGFLIPAGSTVVRAGSFTQMDPEMFPEPEKFIPERWLRGNKQRHNADSFANIPFGHGARSG